MHASLSVAFARFRFLWVWMIIVGLSGASAPALRAVTYQHEARLAEQPFVANATAAGLEVFSTVEFVLEPAEQTHQADYRVVLELLREDGTPVPLVAGTEFSSAKLVELDRATADRGTVEFVAAPRPVVTLASTQAHQVNATLQIFDGKNWSSVPNTLAKTGSDFIPHFTQLANDLPLNVIGTVVVPAPTQIARRWLVDTIASANEIEVAFPVRLARFDDFVAAAPANANVAYRITVELRAANGQAVPLASGGVITGSRTMASHAVAPGGARVPAFAEFSVTTKLRPAAQLDSVAGNYTLVATLEHIDVIVLGLWSVDKVSSTTGHRFLHFTGALGIGGGPTATFTALANQPARGALNAGGILTTVNIPAGTGRIAGRPDLQFASGGLWNVRLMPDGTATVLSSNADQPVVTLGGQPLRAVQQGFVYASSGLTIGANGVRASSVTVELPQGLGYLPDGGLLAESTIEFSGSIRLSAGLTPDSLLKELPAGARLVDEAQPITYPVAQLEVAPASGEAVALTGGAPEWIHRPAMTYLTANAAAFGDPALAVRHSNDGYLRALSGADANISFRVAADSSTRSTATLYLTGGAFITHFPDGVPVAWGDASVLALNEGRFSTASALLDAAAVSLSYRASCDPEDPADPAARCAVGEAGQRIAGIAGAGLSFAVTPQGGLHLAGPSLAGAPGLAWGVRGSVIGPVATHEVAPLANARFHSPGPSLLAADNPLPILAAYSGSGVALAPGVLLLAGYDANTATRIAPETLAYALGIGDYAGINLTAPANHPAGSRLADNTAPVGYALRGDAAKYYVRPSGLSGRHVALDATLPPAFTLYGYTFNFTRFQFAYLSGTNVDVWNSGSVALGQYANFTQRFASLTLTCSGQLGDAELDPTDLGPKTLAAWNSRITPVTLTFAPVGPAGACPPPPRRLIMGVTTQVAQIARPLHGLLGFKPNGDLVRASDGVEGINSELRLPDSVPLAGPGAERYTLVPTSTLRFSNPTLPGAPEDGFVTFGASIRLPFFRNLQVQAITSANADGTNFYLTPG